MEFATMDFRHYIILIHALAAAAGLGTVLLTDYLLISFIKSGRISEQQVSVMKRVSKFIWIALVALILSGVYLALTKAGLGHSSKFLVKVVAVGVLTINGVFLNVFITPRMTKIAFKAGVEQAGDEPDKIRKIAMAAGGISAFSWVIAFLLGKFKAIPASFGEGLAIYLGVLVLIALAVSFSKKPKA
ncbi:MAG: hypothetical protein KA028_02265 [Candidatus Pacebacteria bacterium]|nr:hypothetical protein [Candidatus Paceibacterota bacterium]